MRISFFAAAAAALCLIACVPDNPTKQQNVIEAKVSDVGLYSVTVDIQAAPAESYVAYIYKASAFKGITSQVVLQSLKKQVEEGASWASLLRFGSQSIVFPDLNFGTDYKVLVFGLRGDGTISTEDIVLDATTHSFVPEITVSALDHFGFNVVVKPNDETMAWMPVVFTEDYVESQLIKLVKYNALESLEEADNPEDVVFYGENAIYHVCDPGLTVHFSVVAVNLDSDPMSICSDVFHIKVEVPYDGFPRLAEDRSDNIYTCIYQSEKIAIGTMVEISKPIENAIVMPMLEVNSDMAQEYGLDMFTASAEQIGEFLANFTKVKYDEMMEDATYGPYLAGLHPSDRLPALYGSSTSFGNAYGRQFDVVSYEALNTYLQGRSLETVVMAVCMVQMDSEENISCVPGSVAVARYDFR